MTFWNTDCPACVQKRGEIMDSFKTWLRQPFSEDMDAFHWFLFFGLIIAISIAWGFALRTVATVTSA